ncbi:class B sortase [Bengtsoniella intestinalis]|uniref:class B sortase n=1 Tax=Bengtsoniella intestinalis TaxID=3073143 RepID=UPI00391FC3D8
MKHIRKILIAVLAVTVVISGGYAIKTALDYRQEEADYQEAQDTFVTIVTPTVETPTTTIPQVAPVTNGDITTEAVEVVEPEPIVYDATEPDIGVDFQSLIAVNGDIIGWLYCPGMNISYPLLQGETNQTYINTTYKGTYSAAGSIFADYRIEGNFTDLNTVLYGHNMKSDTMFGQLQDYRQASFAALHPYFFILTPNGYLRYEVCYALLTDASSSVYDYNFSQEGSFASHIAMLDSRTLYHTAYTATENDTIVTLSTCTGYTESERFVLVGRLAAWVITE